MTPTVETSPSLPALRRARYRRWCYAGAALMCCGLLAYSLLIAVRQAREAARMANCRGNLSYLGLALLNYHDTYGCYPPPYLTDDQGTPIHSWRVLILPFIDQKDLYASYRFDEPWDGPHNRLLRETVIPLFNCPSERPHGHESVDTNYLAVVGAGTLWPETGVVRSDEVEDGLANTLMIVESARTGIHWMEPRDLHLPRMAPTINAPGGQGISSLHTGCACATSADGRVLILDERTPAAAVRAWLTIAGDDSPWDEY